LASAAAVLGETSSPAGTREGRAGRLKHARLRTASALRGEVTLEPLLRQALDGAIGDRTLDRLVEHLLQVRVILAEADADAAAQHPTREARPDEHVILEFRLRERSPDRRRIRQNGVNAAGSEIEI